MLRPQPRPTLFPYTTLFRSGHFRTSDICADDRQHGRLLPRQRHRMIDDVLEEIAEVLRAGGTSRSEEHSLNSSHITISYAVFCLKKKKICVRLMSVQLSQHT